MLNGSPRHVPNDTCRRPAPRKGPANFLDRYAVEVVPRITAHNETPKEDGILSQLRHFGRGSFWVIPPLPSLPPPVGALVRLGRSRFAAAVFNFFY